MGEEELEKGEREVLYCQAGGEKSTGLHFHQRPVRDIEQVMVRARLLSAIGAKKINIEVKRI
jgi:hypothetical protein